MTFLNDPTGFWSRVLADNKTEGIPTLLPAGTKFQMDDYIARRFATNQVGWRPSKAIWNGVTITIYVGESAFSDDMGPGGEEIKGRLFVLVAKDQFKSGGYPEAHDTLRVEKGSSFSEFVVVQVTGAFDKHEPTLHLYLEADPDQYE